MRAKLTQLTDNNKCPQQTTNNSKQQTRSGYIGLANRNTLFFSVNKLSLVCAVVKPVPTTSCTGQIQNFWDCGAAYRQPDHGQSHSIELYTGFACSNLKNSNTIGKLRTRGNRFCNEINKKLYRTCHNNHLFQKHPYI